MNWITLIIIYMIVMTFREWKKTRQLGNNLNFDVVFMLIIIVISLIFWFSTFKNHNFTWY